MNAKKLIDLAKAKGYGIARIRPGIYKASYSDGETVRYSTYNGNWHGFVKFVQDLAPRS